MSKLILTISLILGISSTALAHPKKEVINCVKVGNTLVCTAN